MPKSYILDNKRSKLNRKIWVRLATQALVSFEVEDTNLTIGLSPKEEIIRWMKTLKPLDVVITDGNKNGDDFIDPDFLECLAKVNPVNTHFVLLSADEERITKFKEQISLAALPQIPIHVSLSKNLLDFLKSDAFQNALKQDVASRKRSHQTEVDTLLQETETKQPPPKRKKETDETPSNIVKNNIAVMLWQSAPTPALPTPDAEQQATLEKKADPEITTSSVSSTAEPRFQNA